MIQVPPPSPLDRALREPDAVAFDAELLAKAMQGAVQSSLASLASSALCAAVLWAVDLHAWAVATVLVALLGIGMRLSLLRLYIDGRSRPRRYRADLLIFNLSVLISASVFLVACVAVADIANANARILIFVITVGGLAAGSLLVGFARWTFSCWVGPSGLGLVVVALYAPLLDARILLPGLVLYVLVLAHAARLFRTNLATAYAERERAESAARIKTQFMANISHEIRTPMHGVLGNLEVLAQTPLDSRQAALLRAASGSGKALLSLIDEVLDFSKLEAGLFTIRHETVVLRPMLETVEQLFLPAARRKALGFSVVVDERLPEAIESDALRLQQVLMNLLGNAIKFTDAGSVELRVKRAGMSGAPIIEFCVRDSGIGIAADDLSRIFDPFEQVQTGAARRFGGTGLGLSISLQLVQALGGQLMVRSELGQGSIFTVALPLKERSSAAPTPAAEEPGPEAVPGPAAASEPEPAAVPESVPETAPLRVLVVDDNAVNRALAVAMLELIGAQVSQAVDGLQALDTLNAKPFDLVLMDWQMPGLDGLETTRRWRRQEALRASRRVMIAGVTANASAADEAACRDAGMDAFLPKPFTLDGLKALVTQAAQRMV